MLPEMWASARFWAAVKSFEHAEDAASVLGLESDAVVAHRDLCLVVDDCTVDRDLGLDPVAMELERI